MATTALRQNETETVAADAASRAIAAALTPAAVGEIDNCDAGTAIYRRLRMVDTSIPTLTLARDIIVACYRTIGFTLVPNVNEDRYPYGADMRRGNREIRVWFNGCQRMVIESCELH